ncbi:MAG: hypothetical protein AAF542_08440 [Pseudomonadota bacterium]
MYIVPFLLGFIVCGAFSYLSLPKVVDYSYNEGYNIRSVEELAGLLKTIKSDEIDHGREFNEYLCKAVERLRRADADHRTMDLTEIVKISPAAAFSFVVFEEHKSYRENHGLGECGK